MPYRPNWLSLGFKKHMWIFKNVNILELQYPWKNIQCFILVTELLFTLFSSNMEGFGHTAGFKHTNKVYFVCV